MGIFLRTLEFQVIHILACLLRMECLDYWSMSRYGMYTYAFLKQLNAERARLSLLEFYTYEFKLWILNYYVLDY